MNLKFIRKTDVARRKKSFFIADAGYGLFPFDISEFEAFVIMRNFEQLRLFFKENMKAVVGFRLIKKVLFFKSIGGLHSHLS